jgi:hypothetical protein
MAQNGLAIPPPNVRFRENGGRSRRAGSTRTFDGLGLCRKSAYVPVEHIGGRIDMKRHGFSRLSGGGLAQVSRFDRRTEGRQTLVRRQCGLTCEKPPPPTVPPVSEFWRPLGVKFPPLKVPPPMFVPPVAV